MSDKTITSAQDSPSKDGVADKSKSAASVDRPTTQPDKAPAGAPESPKS